MHVVVAAASCAEMQVAIPVTRAARLTVSGKQKSCATPSDIGLSTIDRKCLRALKLAEFGSHRTPNKLGYKSPNNKGGRSPAHGWPALTWPRPGILSMYGCIYMSG